MNNIVTDVLLHRIKAPIKPICNAFQCASVSCGAHLSHFLRLSGVGVFRILFIAFKANHLWSNWGKYVLLSAIFHTFLCILSNILMRFKRKIRM